MDSNVRRYSITRAWCSLLYIFYIYPPKLSSGPHDRTAEHKSHHLSMCPRRIFSGGYPAVTYLPSGCPITKTFLFASTRWWLKLNTKEPSHKVNDLPSIIFKDRILFVSTRTTQSNSIYLYVSNVFPEETHKFFIKKNKTNAFCLNNIMLPLGSAYIITRDLLYSHIFIGYCKT